MRTGRDIFLKRTRKASSAFLPAMAVSILAFGDKTRRGTQHIAFAAEDRQGSVCFRDQVAKPGFCAIDPELGDESCFAEGGVGPGGLAERRGVAFDVEQIVGDLERFAERA